MKQVCARIAAAWRKATGNKIIAIRSTVDPGTCERMQNTINQYLRQNDSSAQISIVYIPEFLREGTALSDYYNPPFLLIGVLQDSEIEIKDRMSRVFTNVSCEPTFHNVRTTELMKHVCNTWHALKVVFANEIGTFCEAAEIDSLDVMKIFMRDKVLNISEAYLTPGGPYGGSCLPKDVSGLVSLARANSIQLDVLSAIAKSNEKTHHRLCNAILEKSAGKPLLIYGLSFKKGTDDIRNSPAYGLAKHLSSINYNYAWYDEEIDMVMEAHTLTSSFSMLIEPAVERLMTKDPMRFILDNDAITIFGKDINSPFQEKLESLKLNWYSLTIPSLLK